MSRPSAPNVLLLGTAEWDAPIATNQHHVARELAHSVNVMFVESLGLRRPTLSRTDLVRMASRVTRAVRHDHRGTAHRPRPDRVSVVSPLILPVHRAATRLLNRRLLRRATGAWLTSPRPRVLWTFTPVTYGLETAADVVVYHCVDLLGAFPGVDAVAVARGERSLAARATVAIATSDAVAEHLTSTGFPRTVLLPNVADVPMFAGGSRPAMLRRPAVLFAGNLSIHKLDLTLLEALAESLRGHGELLLAGPLGAGGGGFALQLRRLQDRGAKYLGLLTPEQLADVAGTCVAGLIPYAVNDYTRGVSPLKCFEYLASGLAVVGTPLPAIRSLAQANRHVIAAESADFPAHVRRLLATPTDDTIHSRQASAAPHGWEQRGSVLRELLEAELAVSR